MTVVDEIRTELLENPAYDVVPGEKKWLLEQMDILVGSQDDLQMFSSASFTVHQVFNANDIPTWDVFGLGDVNSFLDLTDPKHPKFVEAGKYSVSVVLTMVSSQVSGKYAYSDMYFKSNDLLHNYGTELIWPLFNDLGDIPVGSLDLTGWVPAGTELAVGIGQKTGVDKDFQLNAAAICRL